MVVMTNFIIPWELVLAVSGYLELYDFTNLNYYDLSLEANFCTSEKLFFLVLLPGNNTKKKCATLLVCLASPSDRAFIAQL